MFFRRKSVAFPSAWKCPHRIINVTFMNWLHVGPILIEPQHLTGAAKMSFTMKCTAHFAQRNQQIKLLTFRVWHDDAHQQNVIKNVA